MFFRPTDASKAFSDETRKRSDLRDQKQQNKGVWRTLNTPKYKHVKKGTLRNQQGKKGLEAPATKPSWLITFGQMLINSIS